MENLSKIFPKRKYFFHYIAGFVDGEGSFSASVKRQEGTRFGWVIDPVFHITQNQSQRELLEAISKELHVGRVIEKHGQPGTILLIVDNRKQLSERLIPFFKKYRLVVKGKSFETFSEIVERLEKKEHTEINGFKRILNLAFQMHGKGKKKYEMEYVLKNLKSDKNLRDQTPDQRKLDDMVQPQQ